MNLKGLSKKKGKGESGKIESLEKKQEELFEQAKLI